MKLQELKEGWRYNDLDYFKDKSEIISFMRNHTKLASDSYAINDDFTVDTFGAVTLYVGPNVKWDKIPVKFRNIKGDFFCADLGLHSLDNCPTTVNGSFVCYGNKLVNLKGGPKDVKNVYNCSNNRLSSLEGAPEETSHFVCSENDLRSFKGGPKKVFGSLDCQKNYLSTFEDFPREIHESLLLQQNAFRSLEGIADHIDSIWGNFKSGENPIVSGGLGLLLIKRLNTVYIHDIMDPVSKIINMYLGNPDNVFQCQQELIEAGYEEYAKL